MIRAISLLLVCFSTVNAAPWFAGTPDYVDAASRQLAADLLEAHGGMRPLARARSLQLNFFTKVVGSPMPFYSFEAVDLKTGDAYIDWPFWDSTMALRDGELWSFQWPMPMPAGFFIRLTTSFITLPWQIRADDANVGPVSRGRLPEDDKIYQVLRVTFDHRNPSIPGNYYHIYIDPDTKLMRGLGFDINHPGMVANPQQPIGPNFHVFGDYRHFGGAYLPTFYVSYGNGSAEGQTSNAYHFAWDIRLDQPFDRTRLEAPDGAATDQVSMDWWRSRSGEPLASAIAIDTIAEDFSGVR